MPRPYETILIFDSALEESQVEEKLDRLKRALMNGEGAADPNAVAVTHWGKRKLAYPIQKKEQGIYVILRYQTEPARLNEFERLARLDEQVLRQLTVVDPVEPRTAPATSKSEEDDEEE